jgi:hypothetical protein
MISDAGQTWFIKYFVLGIGLVLIALGIRAYVVEKDIYEGGGLIGSGVCAWLIWRSYHRNVVRVSLGGQQITIIKGSFKESVSWMEVEKIKSILWVDFPLYVLTIKDRLGYYLFTTQRRFVNFGFGSKDLSDMGDCIQRKKKELEI